jgi:hypothetical protein
VLPPQAHCHDTYGTAVANVLHMAKVRFIHTPNRTRLNQIALFSSVSHQSTLLLPGLEAAPMYVVRFVCLQYLD